MATAKTQPTSAARIRKLEQEKRELQDKIRLLERELETTKEQLRRRASSPIRRPL